VSKSKKVTKEPKEEVVNVRLTTSQKTTLETIAAREGLGLSTWLLHEGLRAARERQYGNEADRKTPRQPQR
jgi:uncharacterized protein (DUF1778 family)